jgi:nucleotide-binding universal stress UspA family protein
MSTAVVVGVSPTTGSPGALRWGLDEALLRGVPLHAVMAWRPPRPAGSPGGRPPVGLSTSDDYAGDAETRLRDFVTTALGAETKVECRVVKGNAVTALLSEAMQAQLLVVGEPRPGRLSSVRASLVAPQVVLKASCPVVVMPAAFSSTR